MHDELQRRLDQALRALPSQLTVPYAFSQLMRRRIAGADTSKYMVNGHNAGFHRDNIRDIQEEVSDALVIARILRVRLDACADENLDAATATMLIEVLERDLSAAANVLQRLRSIVPRSLQVDEKTFIKV